MTLAVTSFTPTSGDTTGGTSVVITGTGLDAVTAVMFGDVQGKIDTNATNTATSLTVIAPAIPNDDAGTVKITVLDSSTPAEAQSTGNYTYSSVTTPELSPSLMAKWKFQVKDGSGDYIDVRGLEKFQPQVAQTLQDDTDFDSVDEDTGISWKSQALTQLGWTLNCTVGRKTAAGYVEDPGQKILRLASVESGTAALVDVRWYDRNGGDEAYQGTGQVQWSDDQGDLTQLSTATVTVNGRGKRNTITNPAA
jgi:hypothetical protein